VESQVWQYYNGRSPGQFVLLAGDLFDGTAAPVQQFKDQVGATFPFLLKCGFSTSENFYTVYGDRDSYCVINKQGIVRYNAYDHWPYGNRFHLDELRGCIDSLLTVTTGVGDGPGPRAFDVVPEPNPSRGDVAFAIANPSGRTLPAKVEVCDLAGRTVAVVLDGTVPGGTTRATWSGRTDRGPVAAGLYFVRARIGDRTVVRRLARVR